MKLIFRIFVVILLGVSPAAANELTTRHEINTQVRSYFNARDFAALEAMASEFRTNDRRTSSGLHKLELFYFAVKDAADFSISYIYQDEQTLLDIADDWVAAYPESATSVIARAAVQRGLAWHYRGGGSISSVSPEALREFKFYIEMADEGLRDAKDMASGDAYWYFQRAHYLINTNANHRDFLALMNEGLTRHPEAYQLYFSGVDYFAPKWHGNSSDLERYARTSLKFAEETGEDALYARMYWYASQTQYGLDLFRESDVDWRRMRRGIKEVLNDYPDQWNIQNFAVFACIAEDRFLTRDLFKQIEGQPLPRALQNPDTVKYCRDLAGL